MDDLIFVTLAFVFFLASWGLTAVCERLMGEKT
jgi:hypothetical protein